MNPDRAKALPSSGKAFGELKNRQEQDLDSILKEFESKAEPEKLQRYRDMFLTYDVNASGDIDEMELKYMLEKMGQPKTHLELQKMIKEVDTTGKGAINFRDFLSMMCGKTSSILQKIILFNELAAKQNPTTPAKGDLPVKKSLKDLP